MKTLLQLPKSLLYGLALPLIVLNGWLLLVIFQYFESLITIIVTATLLSFILDYPVQLLEKIRIKRSVSILIVILFVGSGLAIIGIIIVPLVIEQLNHLLENLPSR